MSEDYTLMSDAELMEAIADNDYSALEAIYDRYSTIVYTLIKKIVDDEDLAEEIFVEFFTIVWRKIKHYDFNTQNAYCWLVTLARNKAIDAHKREVFPGQFEEYSDDYENYFIVPKLSPQIDSLDLNTALSISVNIEEALLKLTDAQQLVIYHGYYEGMTQDEIAKKLKIPLQTIRTKIKVALTNLKENLLLED